MSCRIAGFILNNIYKMNRYKLLTLLACASAASLSAESLVGVSAEDYLERGVGMFDNRNYAGCIDQLGEAKRLGKSLTLQEEADYYIAVSKYKRGDADALASLRKFAADYPSSLRTFHVWFYIGNCHFTAGNYDDAAEAYGKVGSNSLAGEDGADQIYRQAFCNLRLSQFVKARKGFDKLRGNSKYREASEFYDSYIKYSQGEYGEAAAGFRKIGKNSRMWNEAQYYICQIEFEKENYSDVISVGNRLLGESFPSDMEAELNRVVGESEYHSGNVERAVDLIGKYVAQCSGKPQRSSLYILGVAEYRNGNNAEAVARLDEVTVADDALAQSAYLYIGQAYLRDGNMNAASIAFEKAYNMDYDRDVQETAFYNYAIAQSKGGRVPFSNSVKIFEDFLNKYPESKHASDVEDYIINSYMASRDYLNALHSIEAIQSPSAKMLEAKQNVLYRLGVKELSSGNVKQAIDYLVKSDKLSKYDRKIAAETNLWLGEAYYRNSEYSKSVSKYSAYISSASADADNYGIANFGLGYAYFQKKDYAKAAAAFKKAVKSGIAQSYKTDAYSRIGDCLYYSRSYSEAETYYDKAVDAGSDYALFQKGFMLGLQRRHNDKIAMMNDLEARYPKSVYAPKALYEKAQAYIALNENKEAEKAFNALIRKYPNSSDSRQGRLQLAMLLNAEGRRSEARSNYQSLIREYPSSEEAKVAIEDLKVMYADDGNIGGFAQFMKTVDTSYKIDEGEMAQLDFRSAENDYITDGKTARLKSYLKSYPNGANAGQANYYLAESAYKNGRDDEALSYCNEAIKKSPDAGFAETVLLMHGELLLKKGELQKAQTAYESLREKATTDNSRKAALCGLVKIAHEQGENAKTIKYADELLSMTAIDDDSAAEARYFRAKARIAQGKSAEAVKDLKSLSGNYHNLYGAMAAVDLAEIYLKEGKLDSAEKLLNGLVDSGTSHQYWMARGFILLSDVYKKRGDKFQAREYLESLKENYPGKEADIFNMIDSRLKSLKK